MVNYFKHFFSKLFELLNKIQEKSLKVIIKKVN